MTRTFIQTKEFSRRWEALGLDFVDFIFAETVYLITVYGKNEKDNLSKEERNIVRKAIEALKKSLGGE